MRVYEGRTVVSRGMCLPLSQGYEASSRVRQAEINHRRLSVRVVGKVHLFGQLIEVQAGAMS
jgi:hypothetical protein